MGREFRFWTVSGSWNKYGIIPEPSEFWSPFLLVVLPAVSDLSKLGDDTDCVKGWRCLEFGGGSRGKLSRLGLLASCSIRSVSVTAGTDGLLLLLLSLSVCLLLK
jgi:hypothetical protein